MKTIGVKAGVPQRMDPSDAITFDGWMQRIDRLISCTRGLSVYDLPDCPYRDWYDQRLRPIRAANRALRRAGAYCD